MAAGSSGEGHSDSDGAPLSTDFGFDLEPEPWLEYVRACDRDPPLERFGDYELIAEVGRGGQGLVYRARQPRTGREVALKRLAAGVFATPEMRARFDREIEAAAALDHPHIVGVYGSEVIDGQPILAMQWIDGLAFDQWACPGEQPSRALPELLSVFLRICDAIHHAHQRGVIHRDLKPSNIVVDFAGEPHVLDFGLAKLHMQAESGPAMTQTGAFLGTPGFAAPEQLAGIPRDVDVRTDVFALGALLYFGLTGTTVYDRTLPLAQQLEELRRHEPPPPSRRNRHADRELDSIVQMAVAPDKERRYTSVAALATDVERYLRGDAVLAHPPTALYRARKLMRRHRGLVGSLGALFLVLASATATSTTLYVRAERERERADEALDSVRLEQARNRREETRARAASIMLDKLLRSAHREARDGVPTLTVREALDLLSADAAILTGEQDAEVEAWLHMSMGSAFVGLGLSAAAEPHYLRALELRRTVFGEQHLDYAESLERLGRVYRNLGRLDEAEHALDGAMQIRRQLIPDRYDGFFAVNLNSLAILKRHQRKLAEAEALFLESLDIYRVVLGPEDVSVPVVQNNLAGVYLTMNRPADAALHSREALALARKLHGEDHNDVISIKLSLAAALGRLGEHTEAERLAHEALESSTCLNGDRCPQAALARERLAAAWSATGRTADAEVLLGEAVSIYRDDANPINLVRALGLHGAALRTLGRPADAEVALREAVDYATGTLPPDDVFLATSKTGLGTLLVDQQHYAEAAALLTAAEPHLARAGGDMQPIARTPREYLVRLYEAWDASEPGAGHAARAAEWRHGLAESDAPAAGG